MQLESIIRVQYVIITAHSQSEKNMPCFLVHDLSCYQDVRREDCGNVLVTKPASGTRWFVTDSQTAPTWLMSGIAVSVAAVRCSQQKVVCCPWGGGSSLFRWGPWPRLLNLHTACPAAVCSDNELPCNNHKCVHRMLWCDGGKHCSDSSDEWDCGEWAALTTSIPSRFVLIIITFPHTLQCLCPTHPCRFWRSIRQHLSTRSAQMTGTRSWAAWHAGRWV